MVRVGSGSNYSRYLSQGFGYIDLFQISGFQPKNSLGIGCVFFTQHLTENGRDSV
jgi:hypothetical protein